MTPLEKAESALNRRIEQLQGRLPEIASEETRRHLVQAIVVCVGLGEAITDYVKTIEQSAKHRYGELKAEQTVLTARHAESLKTGQELLERLKTAPTDRALRREIDQVQRAMAAIQKTLRKKADALQREVAPAMGLIDGIASSVSRFCGAEEREELRRAIKTMIGGVQDLYRGHPALPTEGIIDAVSWKESAFSALEAATDFYDCQARAGFQAILALEVMTLAVSATPPQTAEDATRRANEAVARRIRTITERLAGDQSG